MLAALLAAGWIGLGAYDARGVSQAALAGVGLLLGIALYHASFGFTGAWRAMITTRRTLGLRAQMVMLGAAVLLFFPALGAGEVFGITLRGAVAPVGLSVAAGAFMFGIGMQLAGGCASGTLYTLGGGSSKMMVALFGFVLGSVIATHHVDWWWGLASFSSFSIVREWGLFPALAATMALFGLILWAAGRLEQARHGTVEPLFGRSPDGGHSFRSAPLFSGPLFSGPLFSGPWPILWGALALAALNYATLLLAGRPWGVTSAFALWGAKGAMGLGIDVTAWPYWQGAQGALSRSVFFDVTSVMNLGIMAGALMAAGAAGRFAPGWKIPARTLIAALLGGLLLGYGARLAYGCNIGAFFSGIASGSLHGWLWLAAALGGNIAGVRLRSLFGLG